MSVHRLSVRSGGTLMHVEGENMDSVAGPVLRITVLHSKTVNRLTQSLTTTYDTVTMCIPYPVNFVFSFYVFRLMCALLGKATPEMA